MADFESGAVEVGANVVDCGLASTPAMFMTTINEQTKATTSVMVTASHLPFNRNGLKFFTPKGGLDSKDIATILLSPRVAIMHILALKAATQHSILWQSIRATLPTTSARA